MTIKKIKLLAKKNWIELLFGTCAFVFSAWLMFSTFSYQNGSLLIASKAWSDFASHIPLIRSFSFGNNIPPQYPLFPGEPIRYHFIFYFFVGMLEKLGIQLDWALNLPSALSFFVLLLTIYFFAKTLFKSRAVGILSVVLFLFNGSFSFLEFFKIHPLSINILRDITTNTIFSSFGPYDGKIVSAFWNLNIYTNQRHLATAYALCLFILYFHLLPMLKNKAVNLKRSIILGIILGLSFYFHTAVYVMIVVILACIFIAFKKLRVSTFIVLTLGILIGIPQYLYLSSAPSPFKISLVSGYLIASHLTIPSFFEYWIMNLGLYIVLIPAGLFLVDKDKRKIFLCFFSLFLVGNLLQFSPDMATNHKFFNLFIIFGSILTSYVLMKMWDRNIILKPIVIIITFFLILSGIIDFFPIKNDLKIELPDYPKNQDIRWIINNTSPHSIFLDSKLLYVPESLAGRKLFLGWPYFAWSSGYDTTTRTLVRSQLLNPKSKKEFCELANRYSISYIFLHTKDSSVDEIGSFLNQSFFEHSFKKAYENKKTQAIIYSVPRCSK